MKNRYEVRGDITCIFVKGQGIIHECLISTSDLEKVFQYYKGYSIIAQYKSDTSSYYAVGRVVREGKRIYSYVHRVVLGVTEHKRKVDHKNHNPLDNTRCNLEEVSNAENMQNRRGLNSNNTSGVLGVCWNNFRGRWKAVIEVNGKQKHLGYFTDISDAAKAVEEARQKYHKYYMKVKEETK